MCNTWEFLSSEKNSVSRPSAASRGSFKLSFVATAPEMTSVFSRNEGNRGSGLWLVDESFDEFEELVAECETVAAGVIDR